MLLMETFGVALFDRFETQHQHVENDAHVDGDYQHAKHVQARAQDVGNLEGDVNGAREDGQPFGPGADVPEAIGFDEAEHYIDGCYEGDLPKAHIAHAVDEVDEDTYVVVIRIDVEKFQEAFGDPPDIFVAHGEDAEAGEEDYDSFGKLESGYGAHAFDVRGIVDPGVREVGMDYVEFGLG
jgi:hypothetical protein